MKLRPVFIAGCDRSGTTMLGDILGATAASFATPESQWIHTLSRRLHRRVFADPAAAVAWLRADFRFAVWELDLPAAEFEALVDLDDTAQTVCAVLRAYVERNVPEKAGADVWVDHTPDNFKHYPVLRALFPDARYVHIVRDGRAVFQSVRNLDWGPNNAYSGSRHWAERLDEAMGVEMAEQDNCLRVRYEDILADPAATISEICRFAGLDYSEQMLEGGGLILPEFTRGQHQLVGRRPDASRVDAWRSKLSPREITVFEAYEPTRSYMTTFGYAPDSEPAQAPGKLATLWYYLHEFTVYLRNRFRHLRMERGQVARRAVSGADDGSR